MVKKDTHTKCHKIIKKGGKLINNPKVPPFPGIARGGGGGKTHTITFIGYNTGGRIQL